MDKKTYKCSEIKTPLGEMIAISDEEHLYLLAFIDQKGLLNKIKKFSPIIGMTEPIDLIKNELKEYFLKNLLSFKTPYKTLGTTFQKKAWQQLSLIKYGKTLSYAEQAKLINKPKAFRAVANANSQNPLAIIIPCHRVILKNGGLSGYAAGVDKKEWLLRHEVN